MAEVLLFHHAQGLTPGDPRVRRRAAGRRAHRAHAGPVRRTNVRLDRRRHGLRQGVRVRRHPGARRPHGRRPARRARLRRVLARRGSRADSSPRRGRVRAARCCSTRASRSVANGRSGPGPTASPSRSTARTPTRSSSARATSMPPARSSRRSRTRSSSSTPATSTTSPTARSPRTTRTRPRCSPNACSSSWTASDRCRTGPDHRPTRPAPGA